MEKKTIGKFIAALRRAHGMTQKELGERLFVSDKTVSRWECDECTPELSLIPAIAEIFGITTDELLRGERNSPTLDPDTEASERRRVKSDKQFRLLLDKQRRRFSSLTLISLGITILGIIVALIIDLGFTSGLIAFCVAAALFTASELCQICFTIGVRILPDENDDSHAERIARFNGQTVRRTVTVSFINALCLAFMLPLVLLIDGSNYGLTFPSLMLWGSLFALVTLVILYIVYVLVVRRALERRALIVLTDRQREIADHDRALLIRITAIAAAIALVLGIVIFIFECLGHDFFATRHTFTDPEEFKAFMEREYDEWLETVQDDSFELSYYDSNGDIVIVRQEPTSSDGTLTDKIWTDSNGNDVIALPTPTDEQRKVTANVIGADGTVICEYYFNPDLYHSIHFTKDAADKMPVTVVTLEDYYNSCDIHNGIETLLYTAIVMELAVAAVVYLLAVLRFRLARR